MPGMLSSATVRLTVLRCKGFTLIELLVVMLIIGLIAGLATVKLGGSQDGRRLALESNLVRQLLTLAAEESIMRRRLTGVVFSSDGMRFMSKATDEDWVNMPASGPFIDRQLPYAYHYELSLNQKPVGVLASDFGKKPQLIFEPTGTASEFTLRLVNKEDAVVWQINGDIYGNIAVADSVRSQ